MTICFQSPNREQARCTFQDVWVALVARRLSIACPRARVGNMPYTRQFWPSSTAFNRLAARKLTATPYRSGDWFDQSVFQSLVRAKAYGSNILADLIRSGCALFQSPVREPASRNSPSLVPRAMIAPVFQSLVRAQALCNHDHDHQPGAVRQLSIACQRESFL
jgi:hypothetical protein